MNRREFVGAISGALGWPVIAAGQQQVPVVGVLVAGSPDPEPFLKALREGLEQFGYTEGKTIRLEIRSAGASATLLPELAAELVRLQVDIIVAYLTQPARAAKLATKNIPVIMAGV